MGMRGFEASLVEVKVLTCHSLSPRLWLLPYHLKCSKPVRTDEALCDKTLFCMAYFFLSSDKTPANKMVPFWSTKPFESSCCTSWIQSATQGLAQDIASDSLSVNVSHELWCNESLACPLHWLGRVYYYTHGRRKEMHFALSIQVPCDLCRTVTTSRLP